MLINDRSFFEENFKNTETFKHESSIRDSDILAFSETMNGYFNIVVNEAWVHWNKEMQAHTDWYKNDDPIAYKWAKAGSPEYEADFYTSAKAWAAAKAQAVPDTHTHSVTLTCAELKEACDFGAPDESQEQMTDLVTIGWHEHGHSGAGYYAYMTECEDEGSIKLGYSESGAEQ